MATYTRASRIAYRTYLAQTGRRVGTTLMSIRPAASTISQRLGALAIWTYKNISTLCQWVQQITLAWWKGDDDEQPKEVLPRFSVWRLIKKLIVHFPPISAATVALALNYYRVFIGSELVGYNSGSWQDFYKLCLQVAAKIHELWIVASLATIIMDVIRCQLLKDPGGLPLGLLTAKTQFVDALYLLSPDFRHGVLGVVGYKRFLLGLLILTSSAISLLVGPASALLIIPKMYDGNWGAGGAHFRLYGTKETIWPSQLDASSIGGEHCLVPSGDDYDISHVRLLPNTTSCSWAGHDSLSQFWKSSQLNKNLPWIAMQDGPTRKMINVQFHNGSSGAIAAHLAPCKYSTLLEDLWRSATYHAPTAQPGGLTRAQNYRYRRRQGTKIVIYSEVPVVWTTCLASYPVTYASTTNNTYYPLQFENPDYQVFMPPHIEPSDDERVYEKQYNFSTTTYVNSSRVAAIWLETAPEERIGTRVDQDGAVTGRSSAYLNVQIPFANATEAAGFHAACSVDARWYQANITGTAAAQGATDAMYSPPTLLSPQRNGRWRTVRLRSNWLETLTPRLGNASESQWNTLASMLTDMGLDNSTGLMGNWNTTREYIEAVVSTVIVDGMSRVGSQGNGGDGRDPHQWWLDENEVSTVAESSQGWDELLAGTYRLLPPTGVYNGSSDGCEMRWEIAISGLGYGADGTAYYIASAILLIYMTLALGHIIWVINSRQTSTAWSSLNQLFILALRSSPPGPVLQNTSVGVTRYQTYAEHVHIHAVKETVVGAGKPPGPDRAELLFNADAPGARSRIVDLGVSYQ